MLTDPSSAHRLRQNCRAPKRRTGVKPKSDSTAACIRHAPSRRSLRHQMNSPAIPTTHWLKCVVHSTPPPPILPSKKPRRSAFIFIHFAPCGGGNAAVLTAARHGRPRESKRSGTNGVKSRRNRCKYSDLPRASGCIGPIRDTRGPVCSVLNVKRLFNIQQPTRNIQYPRWESLSLLILPGGFDTPKPKFLVFSGVILP